MQFIPAKERFSTNVKSVNVDAGVLRDALACFGREPGQAEIRRLSGGFMNANYLAVTDDERIVVRVYSTDGATADRECDLLTFLASVPVLTPRVLARFQVKDHPVAILEFIDGITLEDRLLGSEPVAPSLFHEIDAQQSPRAAESRAESPTSTSGQRYLGACFGDRTATTTRPLRFQSQESVSVGPAFDGFHGRHRLGILPIRKWTRRSREFLSV